MDKRTPPAYMALVPMGVMIGLIVLFLHLYDGELGEGYAQLSMLMSAATAVAIGVWRRYCTWREFVNRMASTVGGAMESILMIMLIGVLSATWMLSGAVPTMICYGISLIDPAIFLVSSCLLCSIVSLMTGSSWSCIATIGVALAGIGEAIGAPMGWTAGAIISGAYFGDKISPLSDTTVLASSTTGTPIFKHIRYMLFTTFPSLFVACVVFVIAGLALDTNDVVARVSLDADLRALFHVTPWTLLVPVLTLGLILMRLPASITLFLSSLLSATMACILQPDVVARVGGDTGDWQAMARGVVTACVSGTHLQTGDIDIDSIVETGGMVGMTGTLTLIICGMILGAAFMASGMLESMMMRLLTWARGRTGLVTATAGTGLLLNVSTCDQFISIIMTGSIYRDCYLREGYDTCLLSRTVEDSTTVTSVLIPWNSCGATQSAVLGVSTWMYAPYCVFNYISPLMTILVAAVGYRIATKTTHETN
ncbi:MAG: sodium:proton antiporter [Bacteroidaceae bacterium]|nr:sodium:proton antiporter [Bacteroidaceae bacterium]